MPIFKKTETYRRGIGNTYGDERYMEGSYATGKKKGYIKTGRCKQDDQEKK